jgi:hypothetical protein
MDLQHKIGLQKSMGDVNSGQQRPSAVEMKKTPKQFKIEFKCVLNTNGKPRIGYRLITSFPVCFVP